MENPIKMDDLGVPLFLETPHIHTHIIHIYMYILTASGFGLRGTWQISSTGQVVLYRRGYYPLWLLNELDCFSFDGQVTGN